MNCKPTLLNSLQSIPADTFEISIGQNIFEFLTPIFYKLNLQDYAEHVPKDLNIDLKGEVTFTTSLDFIDQLNLKTFDQNGIKVERKVKMDPIDY